MSLEELETAIARLPERDLLRFSEWFDSFRDHSLLSSEQIDSIAADQKQELLRRKTEYLENPGSATTWHDGYFQQLRERLTNAGTKKAPHS